MGVDQARVGALLFQIVVSVDQGEGAAHFEAACAGAGAGLQRVEA